MDAEEEEEEAKRLVKETGITFQMLTGNEDLHKIMDKNLSGFPTTFFIDKNGQPIDDPLVGAPSRDTAKTYIDCITAERSESERRLWAVRGIILILSAAGIGYGIMRGEQAEVLKKAVAVCLQCIGIG